MRLPRTRAALEAARLAAELAEVRDRAERAETGACTAAARIDAVFSLMDEQAASAGLPRPRHGLHLVSTDDRPGAA